LGMNSLAHHQVGQGDSRGQHSHPHFALLRLGAIFFNQPKFLGPTVVTDDDACVLHGPRHSVAAAPQSRKQTTGPPNCSALATTCSHVASRLSSTSRFSLLYNSRWTGDTSVPT